MICNSQQRLMLSTSQICEGEPFLSCITTYEYRHDRIKKKKKHIICFLMIDGRGQTTESTTLTDDELPFLSQAFSFWIYCDIKM